MTQAQTSYRKIGLTGGIGSGKSLAAKRFAELGARVYHADEVSRRALDPGKPCYNRAVFEFGQVILNPDETINRKQLAKIVFSSDEKREKLNNIVHPFVIEELFALAQRDYDKTNHPIAIFEVPLLFESGMDAQMDATILVYSDQETRIRRVMERDDFTREQVLSRMRAQMPEEEKRIRADYIFDNNGTEDDLIHQVDLLYKALKAEDTRT